MQNQTMCGESQIWEEEMCTGDGWNCGEKKNSIVTDVLVEAIFICGKTLYIVQFKKICENKLAVEISAIAKLNYQS